MKKLLLILLLVLAGEISAQQAATIVVKTTPDNEIAYWPTGKEHLFCIALGTKAQAGPLGEFVHQFRTDRPGMVQVWTQGSDSFTLYLLSLIHIYIRVAPFSIHRQPVLQG